jgi:hypothetical protein
MHVFTKPGAIGPHCIPLIHAPHPSVMHGGSRSHHTPPF